MGGHLLSLYSATQASRIKRLTANLPFSIRRSYKHNSGRRVEEERAPSTAEEFKRVAEEKSRQGSATQTVEKAQDAAVEATIGESTSETVKEGCKEPPGKGDFHKKGDQR